MAYDKENRMDKSQRSGRTRDQMASSPLLEGETIIMSKPGRQKRKSYETKLTGINEMCERTRDTRVQDENSEQNERHRADRHQSYSIRDSGIRNKRERSINVNSVIEISEDKGVQTTESIFNEEDNSDKMSQSTNDRDIKYVEKQNTELYSERKEQPVNSDGMESDSSRSERSKENDIRNNVNGNQIANGKQPRHHSNIELDNGDSVDNADNLPNVKCKHLVSSNTIDNDVKLKKKLKKLAADQEDPDKCMICEITEATANSASVEANRLLLEIVYPHEFYDKFQRSGRRNKGDTKNIDISKEPITICKPVKVSPKILPRERSSFSFKPSLMEKLDMSNQAPNDASDTEQSPQKRIKTDREMGFKKEIHLRCKAKRNALVITDDSEGQKMVLKGLKGWITRKEDTCRNTVHKEIKQSLYQVNSLGIQFSLPEYTPPRSDRKQQSPRPLTCIETPRPSDIHQAIRRPITGPVTSSSPRKPSEESNSRVNSDDVTSQHGSLRLRRSYTNVPKLFADSTSSDEQGDNKTLTEHIVNGPKKPFNQSVSFYDKPKSKLSLPPIGRGLKNRSLTLTQF